MDDELLCDTLVDSSLDLDDDSLLVGFGDAVYGSLDGLEVSGAVFGNNDGVGGRRRGGCRECVTARQLLRHFQVAPTRRLLMVLVFVVNPKAPFLVVFFGLYIIRARRLRHAVEPTVLFVGCRDTPNPIITIH